MKNQSLVSRISAFLAFAFISVSLLLTGCGDDSSPAVVIDPVLDGSGIYTDGTATVDGTDVADLTAIIHDNRVMMFSATAEVLYNGTMTAMTDGSFTASVDVYERGIKTLTDQAVSGTIDSSSQIIGTIAGTGVANAAFTLTYNSLYTRAATLPRIVTDSVQPVWQGVWPYYTGWGDLITKMDFLSSQTLNIRIGNNPIVPECISENGLFAAMDQTNVYTLNVDIIEQGGCGIGGGAQYTGLATIVDTDSSNPGSDDVLIFAITNGTYAVFGAYSKIAL